MDWIVIAALLTILLLTLLPYPLKKEAPAKQSMFSDQQSN
jgi:hypothetical protein